MLFKIEKIMKFKIFFIFAFIFSALPLSAMHHPSELDKKLAQAVIEGNIEEIESWLIEGANPDIRIESHFRIATHVWGLTTPLIFASEEGHTQMVKLLLDHHADVNAQDDQKKTALMVATTKGHTKIVKLLLDHDANVNVQDYVQQTALIHAPLYDYTTLVNLLLKHGADIKLKTKYGETALHYAYIHTIEPILKHINQSLDQTNDPEACHMWDQYILGPLNEIEVKVKEKKIFWTTSLSKINAFRMLLHHADKLPLSRKKLVSLTAKILPRSLWIEDAYAFRETIKHLRKNAF